MVNPQTVEEQASLYVLGQLPVAEQREFERRLAQSAELRAQVRQLEEGLTVLAMTAPQRTAPRQVWTQIEKALAREAKPKVGLSFWGNWWRHGWAAATVCLVCWLLYAWWVNGNHKAAVSPEPMVSEVTTPPEGIHPPSQVVESRKEAPRPAIETDAALQLLQVRTQEISALTRQVADLTKRVTDLALDLNNKNVLLAEPSRLKFFQLTPVSGSGANGAMAAPVSTNLQRALFLAMARELGWMAEAAGKQQAPGVPSHASTTNLAGVDFIDLKPVSDEAASSQGVPSPLATEASGTLTASLTNAIPGFVSGTNAVLAFDPSKLPNGSTTLTFVSARAWGQFSAIGTAVLGTNATVVTVPVGSASLQGANVTVILGTSSGAYSIIGQFQASPSLNGL